MGAAIIGLVGVLVGVGATFAMQMVGRRWSKQDKQEDRNHALTDGHRNELRRAYATFVAAFTRYLNQAVQFQGMEKALRELANDAYERARHGGMGDVEAQEWANRVHHGELAKESRLAMETMLDCQTKMDEAAGEVIMLEDDDDFLAWVLAASKLPALVMEDDRDGTKIDALIKTRYDELNALKDSLAGRFVPHAQHASAPPALPVVPETTPALPAASGTEAEPRV